MQQAREQEIRASEEVIHQLQEEEQRLVRSLEYQARQDEKLARKIVAEERAEEREQVIIFQNRYIKWVMKAHLALVYSTSKQMSFPAKGCVASFPVQQEPYD